MDWVFLVGVGFVLAAAAIAFGSAKESRGSWIGSSVVASKKPHPLRQRWYFATVEERDEWMRERLADAIAKGASADYIRTIKRYFTTWARTTIK
jgi:hypothetical protein